MSKIEVMNNDLANKIAAGEVVERTMNVVKELVENAIDANSTQIIVDLIDSGVKQIKVMDDGIGMDKEDALLAFSRHATSKLRTLDDLFHIDSLGFRGEALPSIASVSNVLLKTSDGVEGTIVSLVGGVVEEVKSGDLKKGTSITVTDLFYNTPVRLKYLKSLYTELSHITDYMNKMALSYPNIKFILRNNEKELLNTSGNGDLHKTILDIYGVVVASKMMFIEGENDDYQISGYISYPELTKSNRTSITILVNNRVVRNNEIVKMILESFHTYIPKDRYPYVVLKIDVDPFLVDVNVHPTKMEVKFSKMSSLESLIMETISNKLSEKTLIPKAKSDIVEDNYYEELPLNFEVNERSNSFYQQALFDDSKSFEKTVSVKNLPEKMKEHDDFNHFKPMNAIGIVHKTYIVLENEDGMYLMDQHAAAERINYEKVLEGMKNQNKKLIDVLVPYQIELPKNEYMILERNFHLLDSLGFIYEEFGDNTIIIRSHPTWLRGSKTYESIVKIIDIIVQNEKFDLAKFQDRVAASVACRMSIMAGDYITLEEANQLINDLSMTKNPFTCPHGRPSIITYTNYDLEKMFKRVQ